ncbi:hypothetical protein MBLNU457_g1041t1 [Dothideomycetes sp. NU457]
MESVLEDEITSINAIYAEDTFAILSSDPTICSLSLPGDLSVSLRLELPFDYPDAPPSILGTQSVGDNLPKGSGQQIVDVARSVLSEVYSAGSPCIFDLVEELQSRLQPLISELATDTEEPQVSHGNGQQDQESSEAADSDAAQTTEQPLGEEPPWVLSEVVTEKKSVFVARAAYVTSTDQAKGYLHHLLATDKKVAKATHNITAWRIHGPNETAFQDCDDDGETAAGGRLLHLLQLMDVWDVMIVVTRWYGGVHLGPDRFRLINTTARDAVVKGGFVMEVGKSGKETSGKKGGKK